MKLQSKFSFFIFFFLLLNKIDLQPKWSPEKPHVLISSTSKPAIQSEMMLVQQLNENAQIFFQKWWLLMTMLDYAERSHDTMQYAQKQ